MNLLMLTLYRLGAALVVAVVAACATHLQQRPETLQLPVRFHLVTSPTSATLSTTRDERDVAALLSVANDIWAAANIEWRVERVVRVRSTAGAAFDSLLADLVPRTEERLTGFVPVRERLQQGWNVYLIRDFGRIAGGMFRPSIDGIVLAERGFGFELPSTGRGGATLAHELGHSLGLPHQPCDSTRNIMANACWSADTPSTLTPAQVRQALQQAALGRPANFVPRP